MQAAFSLPPAATDWLVSCCHKRSYVGSNALCVMKALRPLWRTVLCEVARAGCSRCFYAPCTWHHMFNATHRNILLTGFDWQCTVACLPLCRYLPHFFRFESQALQTGNALMDSRKEDRLLNKLHLTLKKQQNKT